MPLDVIDHPSPNHGPRAGEAKPRLIVLHYTEMQRDALTRLCDPAAEVSAHYLIRADGTILRLVAEDRRAWHAGKSFWQGERDLNSASIGIELEHPGHEFGYCAFDPRQIAACAALCAEIQSRWSIPPQGVLGHSDIAPARKTDPGELFPWRELAAQGVGVWPTPGLLDRRPMSARCAAAALRKIGFDVPDGDAAALKTALSAFQRHWRPERFDGELDSETGAALRGLLRRLRKAPTYWPGQTAGRPPGPT